MNNGNEGLENLKELEKLELIIKKFKQLVTEKESEVEALKQQIHKESETRNIWYESEIETLKKEIALVREDAQVQILATEKVQKDLSRRNLELEAINKQHQKLNGELQEKLSKYEDKVAHYRRKGVL